jgi:hypothetical protein
MIYAHSMSISLPFHKEHFHQNPYLLFQFHSMKTSLFAIWNASIINSKTLKDSKKLSVKDNIENKYFHEIMCKIVYYNYPR